MRKTLPTSWFGRTVLENLVGLSQCGWRSMLQAKRSSATDKVRSRASFRPWLEGLEDRCVPAITANPDYATVTGGQAYNGASVPANDTDSEGEELWAMMDTMPSHGMGTLNTDGTYTYTADAT
jgi:hypothetical protein